MKVIIYTNHFYPEDFKVNDIAVELQKRGYDVTVLTAIPDYPKGKYYEGYSLFKRRREFINGVKVVRLPIIPRGKGGAKRLVLNYLSYFFCLSIYTFFHKFFTKYDKVFVHVTSPFYPAVCAEKLAKWQKIPLFVWILDLWPESLSSAGGITSSAILKPETVRVKKVYDYAYKILISSRGFEKSICEKGDYKNKIEYFPNWAETIKVQENLNFDVKTVHPFDNITENTFIILFAGNIGEAQNLMSILEVSNELRDKKNIKFVFIGDGRRRQDLVDYVLENALNDTVYLPGRFPLETMPIFMEKADILLFSLKDSDCFNVTVPAKVPFYMSQAKPILAIIKGEGASVINSADCGFTVTPNSINELKECIIKISNLSKSVLEKKGKNGLMYYEQNFKKENRINQLEILFN